jgi:aspartate/methionine/tyrosine aminotransferase
VPAVQALCKLVGAPNYPFVVVNYPYNPTGVWSPDECAAMATQVLDGVRERLTR